jgi:hypothetical protein
VPDFAFENGKTVGSLMRQGSGVLLDFGCGRQPPKGQDHPSRHRFRTRFDKAHAGRLPAQTAIRRPIFDVTVADHSVRRYRPIDQSISRSTPSSQIAYDSFAAPKTSQLCVRAERVLRGGPSRTFSIWARHSDRYADHELGRHT